MAINGVTSDQDAAAFEAINAVSKRSSGTSSDKKSGVETADSAQDRFLKLLTVQLQNQDPLNPLDNNQMTSQLAQISTVDGITKLNTTMQTMMQNSNESQTLQAAALVGHAVLVPGSGLKMVEGKSAGGFELEAAADNVRVTITNETGTVIRTLDLGEHEAGSGSFGWDGKNDAEETVADGQYYVSFEAKQGGDKVKVTALEYAAVTSVARTAKGIVLTVGAQDKLVSLADVKQII